ncbi:serine hydrolase domain-containing protein [Noviherbaspirillum sp.]|uniref:serine hydrolase domain-containing protein n=1 Tax=Noviherbaspirillum sp. TaxID=1926288 RepID=UPI002FE17EE2
MKNKSKFLHVLCAVSLLGNIALPSGSVAAKDPLPRSKPADVGFSPAALLRIDRFFAVEISASRLPGAVIAIARDNKLVYFKAHGFQDKAANVLMNTDAIFQLASMTKIMATVGALTFHEEGRLALNAPVSDWYPQFKSQQVAAITADGQLSLEPAKQPITVHDLMRHTSGLTYGAQGTTEVHKLYPPSSEAAAINWGGEEFIEQLARLPLLYQPGTVWNYGLSTDVLGLITEKTAGKPLERVLQERLWSKLKMNDTTFHVPEAKRGRIAKPLTTDPLTGRPLRLTLLDHAAKFECAGACAFGTAHDYLRFGQMLLNGGVLDGQRILSPKTVRLMTSDHLGNHIENRVGVNESGRDGYGFGLGVAVRKEQGIAPINGSVGDYSWNGANGTIFWVDPGERLVVVMMSAGPGDIRKYYREQMSALVYGAMER